MAVVSRGTRRLARAVALHAARRRPCGLFCVQLVEEGAHERVELRAPLQDRQRRRAQCFADGLAAAREDKLPVARAERAHATSTLQSVPEVGSS